MKYAVMLVLAVLIAIMAAPFLHTTGKTLPLAMATTDINITATVTGNVTPPAPVVAAAPPVPQFGGGLTYTMTMTPVGMSVENGVGKLLLGRGAFEPITLTLENTGNTVLQDIMIDVMRLPLGWASISTSKIDSLAPGEKKTIKATVYIPETASLGTYVVAFRVQNVYASAAYNIEIKVTDMCKPCTYPTDWTDCSNNKQYRQSYRCDRDTNYKCEQWYEERNCRPLQPGAVDSTVVFVSITGVGAVALGNLYWKKRWFSLVKEIKLK